MPAGRSRWTLRRLSLLRLKRPLQPQQPLRPRLALPSCPRAFLQMQGLAWGRPSRMRRLVSPGAQIRQAAARLPAAARRVAQRASCRRPRLPTCSAATAPHRCARATQRAAALRAQLPPLRLQQGDLHLWLAARPLAPITRPLTRRTTGTMTMTAWATLRRRIAPLMAVQPRRALLLRPAPARPAPARQQQLSLRRLLLQRRCADSLELALPPLGRCWSDRRRVVAVADSALGTAHLLLLLLLALVQRLLKAQQARHSQCRQAAAVASFYVAVAPLRLLPQLARLLPQQPVG